MQFQGVWSRMARASWRSSLYGIGGDDGAAPSPGETNASPGETNASPGETNEGRRRRCLASARKRWDETPVRWRHFRRTCRTASNRAHIVAATLATLAAICAAGLALVLKSASDLETSVRDDDLDRAAEMARRIDDALHGAALPLFAVAEMARQAELFEGIPSEAARAPPYRTRAGRAFRNVTGICRGGGRAVTSYAAEYSKLAASVEKSAEMPGVLVGIQLAPHGVVCLVHPPVDAEGDPPGGAVAGEITADDHELGLDVLNDPPSRYYARRAVQTGRMTLQGPLRSVRGLDDVLIARKPIFVNAEKARAHDLDLTIGNESYPFWGFSTVVLNWAEMETQLDLHDFFRSKGMEFRLDRMDVSMNDGANEKEEKVVVIAQSKDGQKLNAGNSKSIPLQMFDSGWILTIGYPAYESPGWIAWGSVCVILVAIASSLSIMVILVNKEEHEKLLYRMMPRRAVHNIHRGEALIERYNRATLCFLDIVSFTTISGQMTALEVMGMLKVLYTEFDKLAEKHQVFNVETIGDAYIVIGGGPERCGGVEGAQKVALFALDVMEVTRNLSFHDGKWQVSVRAGLASGVVIAGVVGTTLVPKYTLFGDTVTLADAMESGSKAMRILCSRSTERLLRESTARRFDLELRSDGKKFFLDGNEIGDSFWINGTIEGERTESRAGIIDPADIVVSGGSRFPSGERRRSDVSERSAVTDDFASDNGDMTNITEHGELTTSNDGADVVTTNFSSTNEETDAVVTRIDTNDTDEGGLVGAASPTAVPPPQSGKPTIEDQEDSGHEFPTVNEKNVSQIAAENNPVSANCSLLCEAANIDGDNPGTGGNSAGGLGGSVQIGSLSDRVLDKVIDGETAKGMASATEEELRHKNASHGSSGFDNSSGDIGNDRNGEMDDCSIESKASSAFQDYWSGLAEAHDAWQDDGSVKQGDARETKTLLGCCDAFSSCASMRLRSLGRVCYIAITQRRILFATSITFAVLCCAGLSTVLLFAKDYEDNLRDVAIQKAVDTDRWLDNEIRKSLLPLFCMSELVRNLDNIFDELPFLIEDTALYEKNNGVNLYRNVTGICDKKETLDPFYEMAASIKESAELEKILVNIQLAPHGVLCLTYPLNNTEDFDDGAFLDTSGAIGLDLLQDKTRSALSRAAVKQDRFTIQGPITLVQGNASVVDEAVIGRFPIRSDGHNVTIDGTSYEFWGFSIVLMDWDKLKQKFGMYDFFSRYGMEFKMTRTDTVVVNGTNNETTLRVKKIAHSERSWVLNEGNTVSVPLETTDNGWVLTVGFESGFSPPWKVWGSVLVVVCSFLLTALILLVLVTTKEHEMLLYRMMPEGVIKRLQRGETIVDRDGLATIFFSHIIGFSTLSGRMKPNEFMIMLNQIYEAFDKLTVKHQVSKVETIGAHYIVAAPGPERSGAEEKEGVVRVALFALDAMDFVRNYRYKDMKLFIRAGLASGPVVSGVIGAALPKYTIFGDTVNFASRMESTSKSMKIQCSQKTQQLLCDNSSQIEFETEERLEGGKRGIMIKGKGLRHTWWIYGVKPTHRGDGGRNTETEFAKANNDEDSAADAASALHGTTIGKTPSSAGRERRVSFSAKYQDEEDAFEDERDSTDV